MKGWLFTVGSAAMFSAGLCILSFSDGAALFEEESRLSSRIMEAQKTASCDGGCRPGATLRPVNSGSMRQVFIREQAQRDVAYLTGERETLLDRMWRFQTLQLVGMLTSILGFIALLGQSMSWLLGRVQAKS